MIKALVCVVALGAAIGFMIPMGGTGPAETPASKAGAGSGTYRETVLERGSSGHFYVDADVEGKTIRFIVDTGASTVALGVEHARRLGLKVDPAEFQPIARTASGIARGKEVHFDFIEIEGKRVSHVQGMIIEELDMPLLGQSYLARITSVQMSGDSMTLR